MNNSTIMVLKKKRKKYCDKLNLNAWIHIKTITPVAVFVGDVEQLFCIVQF